MPWPPATVASGSPASSTTCAFEVPGPDAAEAVSDAFHAKYGRYSKGIVKTVVSAEAVRSTLRLMPR